MRDNVDNKPNVLFIAQTLYLARSLNTHLIHCGVNADVLTEKRLVGKNINVEYVRLSNLRNHINHLYEFILPISYCYIGKSTSFVHNTVSSIKSIFHERLLKNICIFIKDKKYEYVHINSLILHKLVSDQYPCIIHIRERYDGSDPSVYESLTKAKGVIFIDNTVYEPFKHLNLKHKIILNNPIDMSMGSDPLKHLYPNITVFTYIGRIEPDKGVSLLIDAFKAANLSNSLLLIVGGGEGDYINKMRNKSVGCGNIIFRGIEENIQEIYDITDYVLRGENQQCIGRTMYEGLYSGCEVIIPGNDLSQVFEGETFKDMIHFYNPCDVDDLKKQFESYAGKKIINRVYRSNVREYMERFNKFIDECLN